MNAATHRTELRADRAPILLHPVMAAALALWAPEPRHDERLADLERARAIQSKVVDFCQDKLDAALHALSVIEREIERVEVEG